MKRGCLPIILAGCIVLVIALFAMRHESADNSVRRWADDLRIRMTPPGAVLFDASPIQRAERSATVTWEFETRQTWAEYGTWVRDKLAPDFTFSLPKDESTIAAGRILPGDAQDVRIEQFGDGPPLRVRVTFHTFAD